MIRLGLVIAIHVLGGVLVGWHTGSWLSRWFAPDHTSTIRAALAVACGVIGAFIVAHGLLIGVEQVLSEALKEFGLR